MSAADQSLVTAAILIVGNEILSGRTKDANINYLATGLSELGIRVMEARVIADVEDAIVGAIHDLCGRYSYVFSCGGIGPTHDDITTDCVGKAFGRTVRIDPTARELLARNYANPEVDLNEARLRMARIPDGAELILNPINHAPGYRVDNLFVMAGVPRVMQAMFDGIRHGLRRGPVMLSHSITIYKPEGLIAGPLAALQARHPQTEIGSYPFTRDTRLGAAIVIRSTDADVLRLATDDVRRMGAELGAEMEE